MTLLSFIRLLIRHRLKLILVPVGTGLSLFWALRQAPEKYSSSTTIYTGLASGMSLENGEQGKTDFNAVLIAFDNVINIIKARDTREELALRLMARHLNKKGKADASISSDHLLRLKDLLPDDLYNKTQELQGEEDIYALLRDALVNHHDRALRRLIHSEDEPYYSLVALQEIKVKRIQSSDMIELEFTCDDPGIARDVLDLVSIVFIKNFKAIKRGETSKLADFFEQQTRAAQFKLNQAEEQLKAFRINNRIINYDEQTKFISEKHEDLLDARNQERMNLAAAEASLQLLNEKLGDQQFALKQNRELLRLREALTEVNGQELNDPSRSDPRISQKAQLIKRQIETQVDLIFSTQNSKEGIHGKDLTKLWVQHTLEADGSKARLKAFNERMNEIDLNYDVFAPLGSNIVKMEREIDIAEKEYLSHLASWNASKLREQNLQMASNLQVVDKPELPDKPLPAKRNLFLVAGTLCSFFLVLLVLVGMELTDQTIRSLARVKQLSGLTPITAIPELERTSPVILHDVLPRLTQLALSSCLIPGKLHGPIVVGIFSTLTGEGKSSCIELLAESLNRLGKRVLWLACHPVHPSKTPNKITQMQVPELQFSQALRTEQLFFEQQNVTDYDLIIIEFPALCTTRISVDFFVSLDAAFLIVRSNRVWSEADNFALQQFEESQRDRLRIILNTVADHELEALLGELPKKRSKIRRIIKRWLRFDFSQKFKFSRHEN